MSLKEILKSVVTNEEEDQVVAIAAILTTDRVAVSAIENRRGFSKEDVFRLNRIIQEYFPDGSAAVARTGEFSKGRVEV